MEVLPFYMSRLRLQDTYPLEFQPEGGLREREKTGLAIVSAIEANPFDISIYTDFVDFLGDLKSDDAFEAKSDLRDFWIGDCKRRQGLTTIVKSHAQENELQTQNPAWGEVYNDILTFEAYYLFESFLFHMEQKRPYSRRFYAPRRHALKVIVDDLQDLEDRAIDFYGLSMPPRVGKLLADNTPVLTTEGWKNHGDLKVGDYVFDYDGLPVKVTHVFPKNVANKRVHFTDGSYIDCHENHEWIVLDRSCGEERIAETKEMIGKAKYKDGEKIRSRFMIPNYQPILGEHKDLPVEPYTLGAWLGDGRNGNPDICEGKGDYPIVQSIVDDGYPISWHTTHKTTGAEYYGFKGLREGLQEIGMCHSRKRTVKHIPDIYLCASITQRLELLAGLLDTDGTLRKSEHRYDFSTTEEQLKDDFVSLVSTFGWRCCVVRHEPALSSSGIQGRLPVYIISFNPTHYIPCRLERKQLFEYSKKRRIAVDYIEDIEPVSGNCISVQGGIYRAGRRGIPTHNSTICIFFLAWIGFKRPSSHNAMCGHSGVLADGFYGELCNLILTQEYTFEGLYHDRHNGRLLQNKNSEKHILNLLSPSRFATFTCRGIDGTWTGDIDVSADGYLYIDDLVRDREQSLSPKRMEALWQEYLNKVIDRMNDGARQLMVGTLWGITDPLERTRLLYEDNPRYRFRRIPALDDNDESNFDYEINGFSTEYYRNMRRLLADPEWQAKFQQRPYAREGLLFSPDELRYFNGILPDGDHKVYTACDVAWGGGDRLSMPVCAEYPNGDVYVFDWIFNGGTKATTQPLVAGMIMANGIYEITFEANNGGGEYCADIDKMLRDAGYRCSCTSKKAPGTMDKMQKIIANADDIKRNFIFLSATLPTDEEEETDRKNGIKRYKRSPEYQQAMDELCSYSTVGRNEHDDAADGLTQLNIKRTGGYMGQINAMQRPW